MTNSGTIYSCQFSAPARGLQSARFFFVARGFVMWRVVKTRKRPTNVTRDFGKKEAAVTNDPERLDGRGCGSTDLRRRPRSGTLKFVISSRAEVQFPSQQQIGQSSAHAPSAFIGDAAQFSSSKSWRAGSFVRRGVSSRREKLRKTRLPPLSRSAARGPCLSCECVKRSSERLRYRLSGRLAGVASKARWPPI